MPNIATVSITCPDGEYAAVLGEARSKMDLTELGMESVKPRSGVTGSLLLEISGADRERKANELASRFRGSWGLGREYG